MGARRGPLGRPGRGHYYYYYNYPPGINPAGGGGEEVDSYLHGCRADIGGSHAAPRARPCRDQAGGQGRTNLLASAKRLLACRRHVGRFCSSADPGKGPRSGAILGSGRGGGAV